MPTWGSKSNTYGPKIPMKKSFIVDAENFLPAVVITAILWMYHKGISARREVREDKWASTWREVGVLRQRKGKAVTCWYCESIPDSHSNSSPLREHVN